MFHLEPQNLTGEIAFSSNVKDCRWHGLECNHSFERWYFDALSDDGREALVIIFYDNYPGSPRFFKQKECLNGDSPRTAKFPAVSLVYAVDGKPVLRAVNEFTSERFSAYSDRIRCTIENSTFELETAEYGSGFVLHIDLLTARKRRIKAELEWLSVESDLSALEIENQSEISCLNMAAPRSDVSGRISLTDRHGSIRRLVHFRGTGYHDHFRSRRPVTEAVESTFRGRAHFVDSTAIFLCRESGADDVCAKLFLIRNGVMHFHDVFQKDERLIRTGHGFKVPERVSFISADDIRLHIKPIRIFHPGFFESRMLSEMTLSLQDGKPRTTVGITELSTPSLMRSRIFRWLSDLRIGRNGKGPLY